VTVKLALDKPEKSTETTLRANPTQRDQFHTFLSRLQGRSICILQKQFDPASQDPSLAPIVEGLTRFTKVLISTLQKHLRMNVIRTAQWDAHDSDLVIVPELSFAYLKSIRKSRSNGSKAPVTIFVAMDGLEAATLRSDWRIRSKESVVEIMTQP
jgi:hypothetical protein